MATNALDHLQQKWTECYKEKEVLCQEIERLKQVIAEAQRQNTPEAAAERERKHKIALDNAYENGYNAGRADAVKRRGARG